MTAATLPVRTKYAPASTAGARQGLGGVCAANLDLVFLFGLLHADIRIFSGSSVASFTLIELMMWGYCAPFVVAGLVIERRRLPIPCQRFLVPVVVYVFWLLIASIAVAVFRGDNSVLQNTKSVAQVLVLATFVLLRIRDQKPIVLLSNLYIAYGIAACLLGLLQYKYGAPYFRELIAGTEYKLDVRGDVVTNPVVGFSGHPNGFATAIIPAVAFAILKLIAEIKNRFRVRATTVAVAAILCLGMVLSQARGAIIFTAAASLFIASPLGKSRQFVVKLSWMGVLVIAIMLFGLHEAQSGASAGSATIDTRYRLWKTAFEAMGSSDVLMFGGGTDYVQKWSEARAGWQFPDAHNAWLDQILYFGLPALVLYAGIWWQFFRIVDRPAPRRSSANQILLDGFRAAVMALMGDYFFEPVANVVFPLTQLFLIMSLAVRLSTMDVPMLQMTSSAGETCRPAAG